MTRASIESGVYSRRWIAGSSPATTFGLLFVERSEQPVDQGLRNALIGHRLEQFCQFVCIQMRGDLWVFCQDVTQVFFVGDGLLARGFDQMMGLALADRLGQRHR